MPPTHTFGQTSNREQGCESACVDRALPTCDIFKILKAWNGGVPFVRVGSWLSFCIPAACAHMRASPRRTWWRHGWYRGVRATANVHCQYQPTRCAHSTPPPTLTRSRPSFLPSTTGNCRFGNNCSFQHIDAMLSPEIAKVSTRTAMALRLQCNIDGATLSRDIILC